MCPPIQPNRSVSAQRSTGAAGTHPPEVGIADPGTSVALLTRSGSIEKTYLNQPWQVQL